jgi:hypothetical protein
LLSDKEKRTIARWVDLGGPIDFPQTDGFGYTDDSQLPIINLASPSNGINSADNEIIIGFHDAKSGIDWNSLALKYYSVENSVKLSKSNSLMKAISSLRKQYVFINQKTQINNKGVLKLPLAYLKLIKLKEYILEVTIKDTAGNKNIATTRFSVE